MVEWILQMGAFSARTDRRGARISQRQRAHAKVALFSPSMTLGGAEKMFRRLAVGFAQGGLAVDLVLADAIGPNLAEVPSAIRIVDLRCERLLASIVPLSQYLARERPDVLVATQYHANIVAVWARLLARSPARLILREANTLSVAASNSTDVRDRVVPRLARTFYPCADAIVAVSKGVARDLVDNVGLPGAMVRVIYNPTFDAEITQLMSQPAAHPWFSDGGPPIILSVGRLSPQKRFDLLVEAVWIVSKRRPVRLLILGEGEERTRLESLARELRLEHVVSLPGFVGNPYAYMARAKLYVLSSAWEGLPNALIEAMACGMPVVSTDCPSGPREILDADTLGTGRLGTLVPVGDALALSEGILRELAMNREGAISTRQARKFCSKRSVRHYMDLMGVECES